MIVLESDVGGGDERNESAKAGAEDETGVGGSTKWYKRSGRLGSENEVYVGNDRTVLVRWFLKDVGTRNSGRKFKQRILMLSSRKYFEIWLVCIANG